MQIDTEKYSDSCINRFSYGCVKSHAPRPAEPFLQQRQQPSCCGCHVAPAQSNYADLTGHTWADERARYEFEIVRLRQGTVRQDSQTNAIGEKAVKRPKLAHGNGMAECKPCCRRGSID